MAGDSCRRSNCPVGIAKMKQKGMALLSVLVLAFIAALITLHVLRMVLLTEHFDHNIARYQQAVSLMHLAARQLRKDSQVKTMHTADSVMWHTLVIGQHTVQYAIHTIRLMPMLNEITVQDGQYHWTFYWHDPKMAASQHSGINT